MTDYLWETRNLKVRIALEITTNDKNELFFTERYL